MKNILNYNIIEMGDFSIQLSIIIKFTVFVILVFGGLYLIKKAINRSERIDEAKKYSIYNLIKYFVFVFATISGLQILGFNLSVLMAGSAALLVGIGLGLQNLFSDFVSGIIILVDSSIKVNDVIEINGEVSKVQEINLRTTTVLTRDDKYIILPNTDLTRNQVINWTHHHISSRFEVIVGVDYTSDVNKVIEILTAVVISQDGIQKEPKPFVRFIDFGESSLDFSVIFWSEDVFRVRNIKSDLRIKIFNALKENKITIPFPQRVVHINKS